MIFYFSGCGNSRHVAETIAADLNDKLVFIPEAARESRYEYELTEGESLGFVFPVYSWAPPKLVLDFIEKLQIKVPEPVEGPTYLYFACTCGDECGLTEKIFRKAVEQKGWSLSACFSLQMPETYIGMPGFKLDTDENAQRKITAADAKMKELIPRIKNKESFSEMIVGGAAWLKSNLINPGFNRFATDDTKYRSTEACIHCGKCVESCPLKNVTLEEGRPKWNGHCTMCMACYHHCPVNAIQYGKATIGKGQYYFNSLELSV
ncbi:MAG: EFR1 family ferrodoxin [Bacteroidales bacterium]|nr:EFR1 family ferrodoxin [Bacteroidales bacterium]